MPKLPPWPYPRLCAHRGAGKCAPENTLAAMRRGFECGYRMVEFDVKLAADGVAFLLHDDTLDRTTDARGAANALAWPALARLDAGSWHSTPYAREQLPTLEVVARYCRANGIAANVEIKPSPGCEAATGTAVARDTAVHWAGADVPPLLSSFAEESLAAARVAAPDLPRAYLTDELPADWRDRCAKLGCVALDIKHELLTRELMASAREAGLRVVAWTVNEPVRAATLAAWGVDTIITDAVDAIAADAYPPVGQASA